MQTIKDIRKNKGLSQQEVADMLKINRVTYVLSEQGKRKRKDTELEHLAQIFDVSFELLTATPNKQSINKHSNHHLDEKMFEKVLLYILNKVGIKPNIGKTVLYKLLYFSDFNYYEKTGESITGMDYIKLPMGPAPYNFDAIMYALQQQNKIIITDQNYGGYYQKKYFPNELYNGGDLKSEIKNTIDDVLLHLSDYNASEISNYSHGDVPRQQTKDMEIISYDLAKQRQYPYSVLAREQKRQQAFAQMRASGVFDDLADESDLYNDY